MKKLIPLALIAMAASTALADFNTGIQAGPFNSNGGLGSSANGLFNFTYTDSSQLFNRVRIRGTATSNNIGSYLSELRYTVTLDAGSRNSGQLIPGDTWTTPTFVDNTQVFASFPLNNGNNYTVRLWESYDDGGTGAIDAFWSNLQFDFIYVSPRPNCTSLGIVSSGAFDLNTFGSNFDTELGLYDNDGNLIASNDDAGGLQSQILHAGLADGTYYVAVGGYNTVYGASEWAVTPGSHAGAYDVNINGATLASSSLAAGQVHWYCFTVPTPGSAMLLGMGGLVALRRRR